MKRAPLSRYPALVAPVAALVLALFVMPSSLNISQTNPTQTQEFAPVPPTDEETPPPLGNLSSLGLGTSDSVSLDADGGELPGLPPPLPGAGARPRQKNCVGNPPRQTQDPLAPPCVAYFDGDNFGATYRGVSGSEVRVILYNQAAVLQQTDRGADNEATLDGNCYDVDQAPGGANDTVSVRNGRRWQRYFNFRYQTYGRKVHIWVCFNTGSPSPETRRADAAQHLAQIKPFAVVTSGTVSGSEDDYIRSMAQAGVLVFGTSGSRSDSFFQQYPARIWAYPPSLERKARAFSSYVCAQVVNRPVVDSGNPGENGKARRLGFLSTSDSRFPALIRYAQLVKSQIEACGGRFVSSATFPWHGAVSQARGPDPLVVYARQNMAEMKRNQVSTIIWAGGYEADQTKAAQGISYFPEFVVGGDGLLEANSNSWEQNQQVWRHAWVVTPVPQVGDYDSRPCIQAVREADPSIAGDANYACDMPWYDDLRQLFTGIQVAGPRLTPETIDQGFHEIPRIQTGDPKVPACFYDPGDYTCIKDSVVEHWDPAGTAPNETRAGCWRMVEDGHRYIEQKWPAANISAAYRPSNPCNAYDRGALAF